MLFRSRFRNLISELAADRLVLLSTHIVSDVEYIAGEILLMKDGQFLHTGTPKEVAAAMSDKVWSLEVPADEVSKYNREYKVANSRVNPGGMLLRILSQTKPHPDAWEETPSLEDVFLSCMGEKAGEEDALL